MHARWNLDLHTSTTCDYSGLLEILHLHIDAAYDTDLVGEHEQQLAQKVDKRRMYGKRI